MIVIMCTPGLDDSLAWFLLTVVFAFFLSIAIAVGVGAWVGNRLAGWQGGVALGLVGGGCALWRVWPK